MPHLAPPHHHTRLTHLLSSAYLLSTASPSAAAHLLSTHYSQAHSRDITTTLPRGSGGQVLGGNGGCKRCGLVWILGWNCHVGIDGGVVKRGGGSKRRKMKIEKRKSKRKRKERGVCDKDKDKKDKTTEGNGGTGPRQKWVQWTCGGCGYVAKGELGSKSTKVNEKKEKPVTLPQIAPTSLPLQAPTLVITPQKSIAPTGIPDPPSEPQTVPPVATNTAPPAQTVAPQTPILLQSANQRAKERKKKKNNSLQDMLAAKREREAAGGVGNSGGKGLGGMDLMDLMKLG